jgi:DNA ligase-1
MKPWEVIKQLESTNSRLDKEKILQMVLLQQPEDKLFWEGVKLALDPMITWGIKQVPIKEIDNRIDFNYDQYDEAFKLGITGFGNRSYTGNLAKGILEKLMESCDMDAWNNWYRRILIKDLRCGVTETTINKVRPNTVPIFSCQLAKDAADNEAKLTGKKLLDYKLDGVRVLAVMQRIDSGILTAMLQPKVTLFSRNGKVFENFKHIENQLALAMQKYEIFEYVLDGEITSASFQELMTQARRKKDADASDAVLNVFDIIPLKDFLSGKCGLKQNVRSDMLKRDWTHILAECENVRMLDNVEVDLNTEEGRAKLDEMRDEAAALGLEGIMVKDIDAPYVCKRSDAWLKIKPNITVDLTVIAVEEGTGRNEGRLGAIVCEGEDNGKYIRVNVGSGFSDVQRDDFWTNRNDVIGHTAEVKADVITQNQDGSHSLRFPRFIRFRDFYAGEKV